MPQTRPGRAQGPQQGHGWDRAAPTASQSSQRAGQAPPGGTWSKRLIVWAVPNIRPKMMPAGEAPGGSSALAHWFSGSAPPVDAGKFPGQPWAQVFQNRREIERGQNTHPSVFYLLLAVPNTRSSSTGLVSQFSESGSRRETITMRRCAELEGAARCGAGRRQALHGGWARQVPHRTSLLCVLQTARSAPGDPRGRTGGQYRDCSLWSRL